MSAALQANAPSMRPWSVSVSGLFLYIYCLPTHSDLLESINFTYHLISSVIYVRVWKSEANSYKKSKLLG